MKKMLASVGAICSIAGLVYALSSYAGPENKTTHGEKSPIINTQKGDVNINYNDYYETQDHSSIVLKNPQVGTSLLISEPNLSAIRDSSKHVCSVLSGTPVKLTGRSTPEGGLEFKEVRVLVGECKGKIGWASPQNLAYK